MDKIVSPLDGVFQLLLPHFKSLRYWVQVLIIAAVYLVAAKIGLSFASLNQSVSPVWPPSGVAIAAVILFGMRVWPGVFLGALLANYFTPVAGITAEAIAVGNTLEALAAAALLRHVGFNRSLGTARDVFKFVMVVLVCTVLSATIGNVTLGLTGSAAWHEFPLLWLTWWLGDVSGAVIVAPLLLAWSASSRSWSKSRALEAVLLMLLISLAAMVTFGKGSPVPIRYFPITRLTIPFLLWAAFRLGSRGVTLAIVAQSTFAVWGTMQGFGPFIGSSPDQSLLTLQLFIASNAITFLALVSVVEERRVAQARRLENERRLAGNLAVTQILAESPKLSEATRRILSTVGETLNWEAGGLWLLDKESDTLKPKEFWHAPNVVMDHFESASRERAFAPGVGLPGRVWLSREPVWIADVTTDDNFPRAPAARADGIHSAFGFPIVSDDELLGVGEFFSRDIRTPDDALLTMFRSIGTQLGQFVKRQRAEESLRAKETQLAQNERELTEFFDHAIEAIHWMAQDGTILRANEAELRMMGYTPEEYIGRKIIDFHVERETIQEILDRLAAGETLEDYPSRVRHKSGSIRDVSISSSVYFDKGKFIHSRSFTRDITEQLRAERAIRQLAAIVESTDDAIIGMDLQGKITSWNVGAERLYQYIAKELVGQHVSVLIPQERSNDEAQILSELHDGRRIEHFETVRLAKDGSRIDVSLTISPIRNAAGIVVGASKIARDISDRKRLDRERESLLMREHAARAEAEIANRVKDEFLATLSHELRSPLNAIVGWAAILGRDGLTPDEMKRAIEIIDRNAKVQTRLIDSVLDVSRIVSGKFQIESKPINLAEVLDAAVDSMRPTADQKQIRLVRIFDAKGFPVSGDSSRLQQVFWNLLSNALKFSPNGSQITLILRYAKFAEVVVKDEGRGIDPDFLPHVFDRFRQADSSTTRRYGGLGLGLAIVRHLVELHGGRVKAESGGKDQGAVFTVSLPLLSDATAGSDSDGKAARKLIEVVAERRVLQDVKALVVDDETDARELLQQVLSGYGAEVKAVESASAAFSVLKVWRPEVLLSDISMPDLDGYSFIGQLRTNYDAKLPAIALTANARIEDRDRALAAGYQRHLAKPVDESLLIVTIADLLGRKMKVE